MALFRGEKQFAAGGRNAFDRKTERRPLRKARGGLPKESGDACALFISNVKRGGIRPRVSKGGDGVRHLPGKTVGGLSLSRRLIPACLFPHRRLVNGAVLGGAFTSTGRVCGPRSITGRGKGLPTGSP